ncbi:MAG: HEPN domain-containing protein [Bacteroidales bacterium]|nr:HEPN domain-containing protein [Bacteroidales bacterium]
MTLNKEERDTIVTLELEKAKKAYEEAVAIVQLEFWEVVGNRLYYSLFHAVSALLIKNGQNVYSHKGAVMQFGQHFVKTKIVPDDMGKLYSRLQTIREKGDYNCVFQISKDEVVPMIEPVGDFLKTIECLISEN